MSAAPAAKLITIEEYLEAEETAPEKHEYDRGQKFKLYRNIPSLQEYILISSTEVLLEHYTKRAAHIWMLNEIKEIKDELKIETIQFSCALSDIYRNVPFI